MVLQLNVTQFGNRTNSLGQLSQLNAWKSPFSGKLNLLRSVWMQMHKRSTHKKPNSCSQARDWPQKVWHQLCRTQKDYEKGSSYVSSNLIMKEFNEKLISLFGNFTPQTGLFEVQQFPNECLSVAGPLAWNGSIIDSVDAVWFKQSDHTQFWTFKKLSLPSNRLCSVLPTVCTDSSIADHRMQSNSLMSVNREQMNLISFSKVRQIDFSDFQFIK